jgi:xanthine dehydrogenase molybdopterin-binding subunit B
LSDFAAVQDAIAQNSFHSFLPVPGMGHLKRGDVDLAFQSASYTIEGQLSIGGQEHFYMETNGARAVPKEDGEIEIFIGAQGPTTVQVKSVLVICSLLTTRV